MRRDGAGSSTRPRYPRIVAAAGSLLVTVVAVLGGVGVIPVEQSAAQQAPDLPARSSPDRAALSSQTTGQGGAGTRPTTPSASGKSGDAQGAPDVPAGSGHGRRIVFDMASQRVWLVDHERGKDTVRRSYLVSGSVTDNLKTGTYQVYSKSHDAVGVDDSGTMRYMVRFAHGENAAIGFHDIPVLDGHLVQAHEDLGTPQSHGCIRQWRPDAQALWRFAPVGTEVVVV
jgi:lipoprotein-anchoring transpeptidase ErfK/SrfK